MHIYIRKYVRTCYMHAYVHTVCFKKLSSAIILLYNHGFVTNVHVPIVFDAYIVATIPATSPPII